jgi:mannosyltransferase
MNSDVVICISESTRNDLLAYIPEAGVKDIRVIYNGVSDDYYPLANSNLDRCRSSNYVMFVGARGNYKNFKLLVEALINHNEIDLIITGGGDLTSEEMGFLDECIPGRYIHKSFVENSVLNILYNNAFCLVYPSLYEGFGIPVLEAMKSGCPVVAVNGSSLTEVCGEAAILLDEVTPDSISKAIDLLSDSSFRKNIIKLGFKNSSQFSWDKSFSEIDAVYEELLRQ